MPHAKRVLITCVGSGVGQSVVDSLKHLKDGYYLVGSDQNRLSYAVPDCDDFVCLPRIDAPGYLDALLGICSELAIDVVVPGHDLELAPFALNRERFDAAGVKVIVGSWPMVNLLRDKLAWSRELRKRSRYVVASCSVGEFRDHGGADDVPFPAIAKPSGGSASAGLRIVHRPEDLAGLPDEYVMQPFLFPLDDDPELPAIRAAVAAGNIIQLSEISVQLVYSADGELLGRFASRNRLKAGVPVEICPIDSATVWTAVDEIAAALSPYEPRGPVNLQGRLTAQGLVFFEMNPRFTGITGNRAQFGFNEVSLLVDNFIEGEKRGLYVNYNKVGVRQVASRAWPKERYGFGRASGPGSLRRSIMVLGGTSWLARHFVAARALAGDDIFVVCRPGSISGTTRIYDSSMNVRVLSASSPSLKDVFGRVDLLVNFVSGRPPQGADNILAAHVYQLRMLDLAESGCVPGIINISSQSVYASEGGGTKDETAAIDASEPYAFSKYAIEESIVSLTRRQPSVAAVSLRLARLFGAADGLRINEFPHRAVANAIDDLEIELHGADHRLNLLDVRDAVSAVSFFVDRGPSAWQERAYNVGAGRAVSAGEYLDLVGRVCSDRFGRPLRMVARDGSGGSSSALDCSKLERAGWSSSFTIETSIRDLFEYLGSAPR